MNVSRREIEIGQVNGERQGHIESHLEAKKKRHRHGACLFEHFVGSLLVILVVWSLGKSPAGSC
jgi:hypothetical protein